MPEFLGLGPDNPIAWANFHRKGGLKAAAGTAGAYFVIVAALIFLSSRLDPRDSGRAYSAWGGGLLGLQFLFLVLIGAGRVSSTIRGDQSSGMAESLRMMPVPAGHAVAGYLTSAFATLGGFFVANFVLGLIVTGMAELPAHRWVSANAILLAFALFVWTASALLAFLVKSAGAVLILVSLVGLFGNVGLLYVAPGLLVLAGPLIGESIFNLRTAQTEIATPLLVSVSAQFLIAAVLFAGAARKYRRPDALALNAWLSVALLMAVVGISLLAIQRPEMFRPTVMAREFRRWKPEVSFVGSTALAMLFALIPLANLARLHVEWTRGRADDPDRRRAAPPLLVSGLIVTAVLALMVFALPTAPEPRRATAAALALFGFSLSLVFWAAWIYRVADNAKVLLGVWLICYCLVPMAIDFVRERMADDGGPVLAVVASFSPVGLLSEFALQPAADLRWGAVFHLLLPMLPAWLYLRTLLPKPRKKHA
jgi:hypothetical protein